MSDRLERSSAAAPVATPSSEPARVRPGLAQLLTEPVPSGSADLGIALAIAACYVLLLVGTVGELGYARDEGWYFQAAESYQRWFELLGRDPSAALAQVDRFWRNNNEHPAFVKSLFALSNLAHERWHLFDMPGTSYRFPAMVLSGLGLGLVYLWGTRARGRLVGIVAAVSLGFLPRFFFHAHLACFDAPVVTMWTLCAYAYWRALERGGFLWPLAVGVTFGLALDTKHNSWFLPIVCLLHAVAVELGVQLRKLTAPERRLGAEARDAARKLRIRSTAALLAMVTIGPLVFYALWPWIWHQTWDRLQAYARFHLEHVYYNMEFLGRNYFEPPMPRGYALVMTVATVPTITLLLLVVGLATVARAELPALGATIARAVRRQTHVPVEGSVPGSATALLWLLAIAVQYGAWLSPRTPIFGGTKHWMTAYPFLVLFAAVGLDWAVRHARRRWTVAVRWQRLVAGPALEIGFAACVVAAPVAEALHAHPWGLSAYVPLVGGASGAASLGLNRGFWGYTTGSVAPYLTATAGAHARVYVHDTAGPSWQMLIEDGRIRRGIVAASSVAGADFGIYHHEMHMQGQEYQNWVAFGTTRPDVVAGLDGVPVVWVYRQPSPPREPTGLQRPVRREPELAPASR